MNEQWTQLASYPRAVITQLACTVVFASLCSAQKHYAREFSDGTVSVTVSVSATELQIADSAELAVEVEAPIGTQIAIPDMTDVLAGLEISETKKRDAIPIDSTPDRRRWNQTTEIESLRSGSVSIPTFDVSYVLPNQIGVPQTISTQPIGLTIESALPESVEITEFRDIKNTVDIPSSELATSLGVRSIVIGAIAAAFLAILIWRWRRRRNVVPIQAWAIREIAIIRRRARDRVRSDADLHTDLIEVLRQYVTERFGLNAKTMSNHEMATSLRDTTGLEGGSVASLMPIFNAANRARFAGSSPGVQESTSIDRECALLQEFVTHMNSAAASQERV